MARKYSIAVQMVSDEASEASSPRISAVVQVDEDGVPQVVELTVGAVDGGPIPSTVARDIDFAQLTDALNGVVSAISHHAGSENGVVRPSAEPNAANAARPVAEPKAASAAEGRPYRRMPDAKDVTAVIERTQSVGKLAEHFGVPRYTAQAWVNRLRRSGQLGELDRHQAKA